MASTLEKLGGYNTSGWSAIYDANVEKLNVDLAGLQNATTNLGDDQIIDASAATAQALTDNSGGTPTQIIKAISGSGTDADINDNFSSIVDEVEKLRADNLALRTTINNLLAVLRKTGGCGILDD